MSGPSPEGHDLAAPDPAGEWRRVHPLTPILRSGLLVVAGFTALVGWVFPNLITQLSGQDSGEMRAIEFLMQQENWALYLGGAIVLALIFMGVGFYAVWRSTGYRVEADAVSLRRGLLNRSHRSAPLDRVQSIDIAQPLLARLFSMASLTFDVAGGDDSKITIEYLALARAQALREQLLVRVRELKGQGPQASAQRPSGPDIAGAGLGEAPGPEPMAATGTPEHQRIRDLRRAAGAGLEELQGSVAALLAGYQSQRRIDADGRLVRVPLARTFISRFVNPVTVIGLIPIVVGAGLLVAFGPVWLSVVIPGILIILGQIKGTSDTAGFSLQLTPDGVMLSRGLLSTKRTLVPLERIQALRIAQPVLWRPFGWWTITFNTAGAAETAPESSDAVILPVGTREDVLAVLALVVPDPGTADGSALVGEALTGRRAGQGFTGAPRRAAWLHPIQRPRMGFTVTDSVLVWRSGRLSRSSIWVPHPRVQSLELGQGPLQRALNLATVRLHSTTGPVVPVLGDLDAEDAARLLGSHADRTRLARQEVDR